VALTCDGRVWTWGGNGFGQLGRGEGGKGMLAAVQVEAEDRVCRRIAAGAHHTVAVMAGACALSALSDV
jgi:alpha-tubulin suppressor-like RCC1 family protein